VDHKQKKDLQKKTERKRDTKDKKQSEKTRELEESKGTRVIRPFWFAVVRVHSLDGGIALLVFFPYPQAMRLYNKRANPFGKHKLTFKQLSLILSDAAMCDFV